MKLLAEGVVWSSTCYLYRIGKSTTQAEWFQNTKANAMDVTSKKNGKRTAMCIYLT